MRMLPSGRQVRIAAAIWLPLNVATTGLAALSYGLVQQDLRQGFDAPQIRAAEDAARRLDAGATPADVAGADKVDAAVSLDTFVMVFDSNRRLVASGATIRGGPPDYPAGIFDTVRSQGQDRVTWQPDSGVRVASVAVAYHDGFVVAGRSMRVVEDTISHVEQLAAFMWLLTLGATAAAALASAWLLGRTSL